MAVWVVTGFAPAMFGHDTVIVTRSTDGVPLAPPSHAPVDAFYGTSWLARLIVYVTPSSG
jgi:hypothetical protein